MMQKLCNLFSFLLNGFVRRQESDVQTEQIHKINTVQREEEREKALFQVNFPILQT